MTTPFGREKSATPKRCVVIDPSHNTLVRTLLETASFSLPNVACHVLGTLKQAEPLLSQAQDTLMLVLDPRVCDDARVSCTELKGRAAIHGFPIVLLVDRDTNAEVIESAYVGGADDCIVRPLRVVDIDRRLRVLGEPRAMNVVQPAANAPRILLVGGSRHVIRRLSSYLSQSGYDVRASAADFSDPERLLKTEAPQLVLFCHGPEVSVNWSLVQEATLAQQPMARLDPNAPVKVQNGRAVNAWFRSAVGLEEVVRRVNEHFKSTATLLRVHERAPFYCPVELQPSGDDAPLSCFSYDLSPGGIFVKTLIPPAVGTQVQLKIHLTTTREQLDAAGVVVWANPHQQRRIWSYPVGAGIRFSGQTSKRLEELTNLCAEFARSETTGG